MTMKFVGACFTMLWSVPLVCVRSESVASEGSSFKITIHIYNYSAVSTKALDRAKEEGGRIFKHAGLTVCWLYQDLKAGSSWDPQNLTDTWDQFDFVLRLLEHARPGLRAYATGEAFSSRIANVFLDRVISQSVLGEIFIGQLLGHAMAHEIGHLLLGENSHGSYGIMVASWSKNDMKRMSKGDLLFTSEEIQWVRSEVKRASISGRLQLARVP